MNAKPRSTDRLPLEVVRKMTPEQRLLKAIELSELAKQEFREELRQLHQDLDESEFQHLFLREYVKKYHGMDLDALMSASSAPVSAVVE